MSALAPSLWLLGGSPIIPASSIWILLLARSLPSILYVRARLRLEYNENAELMPLIGSIAACAVTAGLVYAKLLPVMVLLVMVVLFICAAPSLSMMRVRSKLEWWGCSSWRMVLMLVRLAA